jgi:hypothetical protein
VTPPLAQRLIKRLEESLRHLDAVAENVDRRRTDLTRTLAKELARADVAGEVAATRDVAALNERVLELVRTRDFRGMTFREARVATRMLPVLEPKALAGLLAERPEVWPSFAESFLRHWDTVNGLPTRPAIASLVARAPKQVPFLHQIDPSFYADPIGPYRIATEFRLGTTLPEIATTIGTNLLLKLRWDFSAHVLANATIQAFRPKSLGMLWKELGAAPEHAALIFPPARASSGNVNAAPTGSLVARGIFVAELLRLLVRGAPASDTDAVTAALVGSTFGDPRVPPLSYGWQVARSQEPNAFARFLEQLVREDLALFFEYAMNEHARRDFWLRYLPLIRRTVCVMTKGDYRHIKQSLGASDKKLAAALERVRRFRSARGVNAFCLFFDEHVVVEFSDTGNAAYVYERSRFSTALEARLMAGELDVHDDLKRRDLRPERIRHHRGWEGEAARLLAGMGIGRVR